MYLELLISESQIKFSASDFIATILAILIILGCVELVLKLITYYFRFLIWKKKREVK